ncbi:MAG: phosphopantetheine-binding protein [Paracoccaceae bacterium]|nr:phosphopantetheine-binding protein [Paracoccaceae bacterium]
MIDVRMAELDDIDTRVLDLLKSKIGREREIAMDSNVVEDTGLDSVSVMDFVMELEDEFDISVPLDEIAEVRTVSDLAGVVRRLTAAGASV